MSIFSSLSEARDELVAIYDKHGGIKKEFALHYLKIHVARYERDLAPIVEKLTTGARILDLGAAPFLVPYALAREGYDVTAVDLHPADWLDAPLPFKIVTANCDGEPLPFADDAFDCVIFTEVFEHLHVNLNHTMKEIHRVLKSGGFLYLTTPNLLGLRGTLRLLKRGGMRDGIYECWEGAETGGFLGHVREYTPREIANYLPACGYSKVMVDTVNVYDKSNFETLAWKALSAPFRYGKENIRAIAYK